MFLDKESFKYLFDQYYNPLCNYVSITFKNAVDAEDVVMDVFTHIWSTSDKIDTLQTPKSYLFKSVHNKALEKIRAKKVEILSFDAQKIVVVDYKEENADNFLLKEKIYNSIRQLPKQCQLIFVKAKIDGLSYKEIAADLNLSIKTIENQMSKALKILRASVKN
jgi:RNA polymerase sigma-70 factor (family 1)